MKAKKPAEQLAKDIRRPTRRHIPAEDKIRIVLDDLRDDDSIAELCRTEGIAQNLYYTWPKESMEVGKRGPAGDTARSATTDEVKHPRGEVDIRKWMEFYATTRPHSGLGGSRLPSFTGR